MESEFALLALLVAGYALIAARLERLSVSPALVFLVIGVVLSDDVLGPISFEPTAEPVKLLAEVTLTLLLFADASTIRATALRKDAEPVARLLIVGLLLTIAFGTLGALALFPGVSLGVALLIGSTLAPTDAALGQPVITNPSVPARVRRLLNVESGLNDGIATPFVFLAVAIATTEGSEASGLAQALTDLAIGVAVGAVLGFVGGSLLVLADRRPGPHRSRVSCSCSPSLSGATSSPSQPVAMASLPRSSAGSRSGREPARARPAQSSSPRRRDRCWRSASGPRSGSPWPARC